ncbi:protein draper isoform X3 [Episyrphus balteatus]|uniref:protein draper isoform X3 n=1 Tax=Episyrphus balteatus TaxID=286459 RepID=UPI002485104B|nr:protein draper isoform X3 [Episyrphus balteatus]
MNDNMIKIIYLVLALGIFTAIYSINAEVLEEESELEGPHVCKKTENYNVEVTTTEMQSFQERVSIWCWNVPPRCSTYRLKTKKVNKTQILSKSRIVKDCCEGYELNPEGNSCIPVCNLKCQHGSCVAPDKCKCEHGFGGPSCDITCRCMNNSSCDAETGKCICSKGWTGDDCSKPCQKGFYGAGCKEKCPDIIHGNKSCDHITGEYVCRPGYVGMTCEHPCPLGLYGPGCGLKCNCKYGSECNHINGHCQCLPGWTGANCNESCPEGFYGLNCAHRCQCAFAEKCRKNDGYCICLPGYTGTRCDEVCPEGFYGEHCKHVCDCPSQNFQCHITEGCVCRRGYKGENCDIPAAEQRVQEVVIESSRAGLAWGLVLAILFVGIVVAIVFYYRRRVSNLKTEIQHVQYITDPHGSYPDRHNFDNPVYGFQGPDTRLLNNLRPKMNNLDRTNSEYDDSNASSRAGTYSINYNSDMLQKNLNADLTNPNVYNSIEDPLKEEHVYDEIKQKEGYKDPVKEYRKKLFPDGIDIFSPDEYDHLDYSRPSTSFKPHYHRMNDNTILNINSDEEKPSNLKTKSVLLEKTSDTDSEAAGYDDSICDNMDVSTASASSSISPKK